jgi:hypothetical protein
MDISELKAKIAAARYKEVDINGSTYCLSIPHDHAWRCEIERHIDKDMRVLQAAAFRNILQMALTGWRNVKTTDLEADLPEEPLAFSPEARELLLDHRQDIADTLARAIGEFIMEQRERHATQTKN